MCPTAEIELFAGDYQYRFNKLKAACTALLFKVIESQRQGSFHQARSTAAQQSGKKENKERQRHVYPMRHLWVEWSEGCQKKLRLIFAACTNKHNSWCVSIISASAPVFFLYGKMTCGSFFSKTWKVVSQVQVLHVIHDAPVPFSSLWRCINLAGQIDCCLPDVGILAAPSEEPHAEIIFCQTERSRADLHPLSEDTLGENSVADTWDVCTFSVEERLQYYQQAVIEPL